MRPPPSRVRVGPVKVKISFSEPPAEEEVVEEEEVEEEEEEEE